MFFLASSIVQADICDETETNVRQCSYEHFVLRGQQLKSACEKEMTAFTALFSHGSCDGKTPEEDGFMASMEEALQALVEEGREWRVDSDEEAIDREWLKRRAGVPKHEANLKALEID